VLAKRGATKCLAKWGPTGEYLSEKLAKPVKILPLKFTQIEPMVAEKKIDFVLANSAFYVELEKKHGVKAVASLINSRQGKALRQFGGVIIVKKDSPIRTLADLEGKKFMCVKYSSFGGGHMAWRLLLESGIDPKKDCAKFVEGGKHDNVVLAVKAGAMDAGTVRSDTLERMAAEGKIELDEFRILGKVDDDFPFVHSTRLYPEWPMAVCAHATAHGGAVGKALQALAKDAPAARAAKCVGWCAPLDYAPVVECLKAIQYGVFATK
jgi:phosphate/phosphite/phosphonate ABC transporter binding protein